MNVDITDFSCRKSGEVNTNKALYESALDQADKNLYSFKEARKLKSAGKLSWDKTTNPDNFLDEDFIMKRNARAFNTKTNPVKELLSKKRFQETLKYGSTKEDLENEVRDSLGIELLQLFQNHGVTGDAVKEIIDIFLDMIGDEPDVDELIDNWNTSDENAEEPTEPTDDMEEPEEGEGEEPESNEELTESRKRRPNTLNETIAYLRKRVSENKIKRNLKESYYEEDEEVLAPTEAQLRAIVRKYPYLVAPEFGGMVAGETRTVRGETFKATKDGTMTPEEVYYKQASKNKALKDPASKTYEYMINNGFDINNDGSYRSYQV